MRIWNSFPIKPLPFDGPILQQIYSKEEGNKEEIDLLWTYLGKEDENEEYPEMDEEEIEVNKI